MEDLNKNQIVLLTLLVSFVTSIATGIITVSLLQEAPIEVTRNINRIVEKTIETVTPSTTYVQGQKEVTTVVVKEEDLIVDSINKNIKSIVRIKEKDTYLGNVTFYGIGLVVTKDGYVSADRKLIIASNLYTGVFSDGKEFTLKAVGQSKDTDFILFKVELPENEKYTFVPATFSTSEPKLGQTIISLGGNTSNTVSVGRINSLDVKESGSGTTTTKYIASIDTNFSEKDYTLGSPIFNLSGDVIGIKITNLSSSSFTPISVLKNELNVLVEPPKTE